MADTTELVPELLEAGVHFGHQTKRWNPKMKPFIFEQRNQIYIINLDETVRQLQHATEFLQDVARRGGRILFVGCKKQAQEAIKEAALACGQFYVNQRWLGGTLTNLATIRKSIGRLKYIEQIEQSSEYKKMGKQELAALNREAAKLRRNLEGIIDMSELPDALVVIDTIREQNAVNEARRLGIPVVAIVDTNADPELVDYPIAGNDDAIRAIRVILQKLVDAIVSASSEARIREQVEMAGVSAWAGENLQRPTSNVQRSMKATTEIDPKLVKQLREKTNAGFMDCKRALVESGGDLEKAETILRTKGIATAAKKATRATKEGIVASYIHLQGKVGVLVEVNCETDFVARNENFREFVKDITLHIAAAHPLYVGRADVPGNLIEAEREIYKAQVQGKPVHVAHKIVEGKLEKFYSSVCLLEQGFIKNPDVTVGDLLNGKIAELGENIVVRRFVRYLVGEPLPGES